MGRPGCRPDSLLDDAPSKLSARDGSQAVSLGERGGRRPSRPDRGEGSPRPFPGAGFRGAILLGILGLYRLGGVSRSSPCGVSTMRKWLLAGLGVGVVGVI